MVIDYKMRHTVQKYVRRKKDEKNDRQDWFGLDAPESMKRSVNVVSGNLELNILCVICTGPGRYFR